MSEKKHKNMNYAKWGYFFILPFFLVYFLFSMYPLIYTIVISFFENYRQGLDVIGPNFIGLKNYATIFTDRFFPDFLNTMIIWLLGFIPQLFISLLFASWFTDIRLKLRFTGFFKIVDYLPNILMASSVAVLFYVLFSNRGPINELLAVITNNQQYFNNPNVSVFKFVDNPWGSRAVLALINFLMWYGNTTILLMAAIMGVDPSLYESAQIDGASPGQTFRKITLPLIKPVLLFVMITSLIGGIQMFDVPQLWTNATGAPDNSTMTLVMYLNNNLFSKNYGRAGAISVVMLLISAILSVIIFFMLREKSKKTSKSGSRQKGGQKA